jgi:hypothetical protein
MDLRQVPQNALFLDQHLLFHLLDLRANGLVLTLETLQSV